MTTNQISHLSTDQISTLESADLRALGNASIASLTTDQLVAITTDQFQTLTANQVAHFTTAQMHALTTDQVVAFTTDQIVALTTAEIGAMTMTQINAFEGGDVGVMSSPQLDALFGATPIVLDLDGTGIHTLSASNGVNFDLAGTGTTSKVGWVTGNSGLLAMDRNHDGTINDGTELFGLGTKNADGTRAGNGYAAMALEDSNHDHKLTAADAHFKDLKVWVDVNHDGKSDAGELHGLADFGIVSLDLQHVTGTQTDNGNLLGMVSSYTTADGAQHQMADVLFAKDTGAAAPALSELLAGPAAEVLPATPSSAHAATTVAAAAPEPVITQTVMPIDEHKQQPLI
jgi:hypothetical protein